MSGLGSGRSVEIFDRVLPGILFTLGLFSPGISSISSYFWYTKYGVLKDKMKSEVKMDFRKRTQMMKGKFGKGTGLGLLTLAYVRI